MATAIFQVRTYLKAGSETLVLVQNNFECEYAAGTSGTKIAILNDFVAFPDSRAYKIELVNYNATTDSYKMRVINLIPSRAYNYAFYVQKSDDLSKAILYDLDTEEVVVEKKSYRETNVLLVSESSVPFYFPVQHSYKVGGNIQDLSLMVEQISEAQTGQYPVIILSDKGIFALEQGSGIVLYSNIIPISNDICSKGTVQTRSGVAYMANKAVNLLSGRKGINISKALEGIIDGDLIRASEGFPLATQSEDLYDVSNYLSGVDFREFVKGAILMYDSIREEVIVSNKAYKYSYVYGIMTGLWHKITSSYLHSSGKYALEIAPETKVNLVDLNEEFYYTLASHPAYAPPPYNHSIIHLQTRPLKFDSEGYKTIYRALLRGMIYPGEDKPFGCYIFASNNMRDWTMVSAAQTEDAIASLRMYRIKRSYRYFIIVAGGYVQLRHGISFIDLEIDDKYESKER